MKSSVAPAPATCLWLLCVVAAPACFVSFHDFPLEAAGGSLGAGGSSGNAGQPSAGGLAGVGRGLLIDDFEDGDATILPNDGRSGDWYAANDGRGTQTPAANTVMFPALLSPPRGGSQRAAHTFGGPFAVWGAFVGTPLAHEGAQALPYDLSRFAGLRCWVRSGGSGGTGPISDEVRLSFPTPETSNGGGCTACNDHFGADIALTTSWKQVEVRFSDLTQSGWGQPQLASKPNLAKVLGIQFLFPANVRFDLWLDDVELY